MSLFSYMITLMAVLFWIFRVVVTLFTTTGTEFIIQSLNPTVEIILCFVTLICLILISKRKLSGALIYLISYCAYFGVDVYNSIAKMSTSQDVTESYLSITISAIAVLIAFLNFVDVRINK